MKRKANSATFTVFVMIVAMVISKMLGMLRGVLLASAYGTTEYATAFSAASRIPLSFFDIIFASAILGCFIPVYNSVKESKRNSFTSIYLNFLLLLTGVVSLLGIAFADPLLNIVAPGLQADTHDLAVTLLRIMFPLIIFAAASYTFVGLLQSNGEYIVPAFISAVSNFLIIVYFVFLNGTLGVKGLAVAYTVSWCVQLLTLVVPVIKKGYRYKLLFNFKDKDFISALKLTPPIIMGSWLSPVCLLLSMRFATYTQTAGAVPSFEYAINLFTVITGITTYGVCNYIFPKLSKQANTDNGDFSATGRLGLLSALLMTVPIAAVVMALAPHGIAVVYMRGEFDVEAARSVAIILRALVAGMIGFTLVEFLSRTFYAMKKPLYVVIGVVVGIVTDLILLIVLVSVFEFDIWALGIAYSVGILASGTVMFVMAAVRIKGFVDVGYLVNLTKILLSGIFSFGIMFVTNKIIGYDPYSKGMLVNLLYAFAVAFEGMIVYLIALLILREQTVTGIVRSRKRRE